MKECRPYLVALVLTLITGILFISCATKEIKRNRIYTKSLPPITIVMPIYYDEPMNFPTIAAEQHTRPIVTLASRKAIISLPLPKGSDGSFKAFERMSSITRQSSKQWHLKQIATVDNLGFYRVGNYYCIAIGQFYSTTIGETFTVQFESRTISVIISDVKANEDCVNRQYCKANGSIIEFIVSDKMTHEKLQVLMPGKVISIIKEAP